MILSTGLDAVCWMLGGSGSSEPRILGVVTVTVTTTTFAVRVVAARGLVAPDLVAKLIAALSPADVSA